MCFISKVEWGGNNALLKDCAIVFLWNKSVQKSYHSFHDMKNVQSFHFIRFLPKIKNLICTK